MKEKMKEPYSEPLSIKHCAGFIFKFISQHSGPAARYAQAPAGGFRLRVEHSQSRCNGWIELKLDGLEYGTVPLAGG